MTLANAAYLGIERFANDRNKENRTNATENDKAALIRAVYKQVLGNQYVMASERLEGPESLFKRGYLSVRDLCARWPRLNSDSGPSRRSLAITY